MARENAASISVDEVNQFSRHAGSWWDKDGPFRPLHRLNPVRVGYIRDQAIEHFNLDPDQLRPLKDLSILDVGCGGGILAEPLARMGADVAACDASKEGIKAAKDHARASKLKIDYRVASAEEMAATKKRYDIVTALEIVEHVADVDSFVGALAKLLKPKGLLIMSTLNRTPKSFLLGIIAAEYVLRWVPKGTHDWRQFLRPSELSEHLVGKRLRTSDVTGLVFNPLRRQFELSSHDMGVNYLLTATR